MSGVVDMPEDESGRATGWAPLIVRRRFQLAGALLLAGLGPYVFRVSVDPGMFQEPAIVNALIGNLAAVFIAFWARLSIEPYPGIRSSYVIFPTAAAAHGIVLAALLMTRLPYERIGLAAGFLLHIAWAYAIYVLVQRRLTLRIGVVPFGNVARLKEIRSVEWVSLSRPSLLQVRGCNAIVADFVAELPDEWEAFLADAALAGTIVYQVKPLAESLTGRVEIDHLSENSFGSLLPMQGYFYLKGLLDFLLAIALLPLVALILTIAALAIRLEGRGPVLFRQFRVGHAGHPIRVYKLRTMLPFGAGGDGGFDSRALAMTEDDDPRITRVGSFLRRSRIDELPQVWNILKGEMSWIGPRPEAAVLSNWYVREIPFYRYRHVVKPGISGWAQVNQGHVAEVEEVNRKLQYDFYYIKYFSPWLDLLILFKTLRTVFTGFGSR